MTVTSNIEIEWLTETSDCDQPGCSGGYSTGARVTIDEKVYLELIPVASCFGGESWDVYDVYSILLSKLCNANVQQTY